MLKKPTSQGNVDFVSLFESTRAVIDLCAHTVHHLSEGAQSTMLQIVLLLATLHEGISSLPDTWGRGCALKCQCP